MKKKGFTLVELLAVITVLGMIIIIAVPKINDMLSSARLNTFKLNEDHMIDAAKGYMAGESLNMPSTVGDTVDVSYITMRDLGYVENVYDPRDKTECTNSYVTIKKATSYTYEYIPKLVCDNYISIDGWNMIDNSDFEDGTTSWIATGGALTVSSSAAHIVGSGASDTIRLQQNTTTAVALNHNIYMSAKAKVDGVTNLESFKLSLNGTTGGTFVSATTETGLTADEWITSSGVITSPGDLTGYFTIKIDATYTADSDALGRTLSIDGNEAKVVMLDLNAMGLSSKTAEEIDQMLIKSGYNLTNETEEETDNTAPVLALVGDSTTSVIRGTTYADAGAVATDVEDGNITSDITVVNTVDTAELGEYLVTYYVTDSNNVNAIPITRTVNVVYPTGWDNRLKISVESDLIDEDLEWFPLTVHLNTANGTDAIFTEVGANSKKIMFTKDDGETEIYAEIEDWDETNKKATIHVSADDLALSSTTDTTIYMYYDSDHADNTTYIGDYASIVGQNVWDSNYVMIQHMGTSLSDSTSNSKNGTNVGTTVISAEIGYGRNFDGSNDKINIGSSVIPAGGENYTASIIFNADTSTTSNRELLSQWTSATSNNSFFLGTTATDNIRFSDNWNSVNVSSWVSETYYYLSAVSTNDNAYLYLNDTNEATKTSALTYTGVGNLVIGEQGEYNGEYFDGIIDEIRISNSDRSAAWISAEYNSLFDNLNTYTIE